MKKMGSGLMGFWGFGVLGFWGLVNLSLISKRFLSVKYAVDP